MRTNFRIRDCTTTHVGKVRTANEDSHASIPQGDVWLVADGMGGHYNGSFASTTIAEAVAALPLTGEADAPWDSVAQAIHQANGRIFTRSVEVGKQIGSTVVALVIHGQEFVVLWAGDSRAYLYRGGQLIQLTRDHTQVEIMLERGLLTPEEAADHPMKHVLGRAVGVQETLELDAIRDHLAAHDLFLLCSDGLHGVLSDEEIALFLRDYGHEAGDRLIAACLDRGAPDNVTVALVAVDEPTLLSLNGAQP